MTWEGKNKQNKSWHEDLDTDMSSLSKILFHHYLCQFPISSFKQPSYSPTSYIWPSKHFIELKVQYFHLIPHQQHDENLKRLQWISFHYAVSATHPIKLAAAAVQQNRCHPSHSLQFKHWFILSLSLHEKIQSAATVQLLTQSLTSLGPNKNQSKFGQVWFN